MRSADMGIIAFTTESTKVRRILKHIGRLLDPHGSSPDLVQSRSPDAAQRNPELSVARPDGKRCAGAGAGCASMPERDR
jgi:hypothetical protein